VTYYACVTEAEVTLHGVALAAARSQPTHVINTPTPHSHSQLVITMLVTKARRDVCFPHDTHADVGIVAEYLDTLMLTSLFDVWPSFLCSD